MSSLTSWHTRLLINANFLNFCTFLFVFSQVQLQQVVKRRKYLNRTYWAPYMIGTHKLWCFWQDFINITNAISGKVELKSSVKSPWSTKIDIRSTAKQTRGHSSQGSCPSASALLFWSPYPGLYPRVVAQHSQSRDACPGWCQRNWSHPWYYPV